MTTHEGEDVARRPRSWSRVLVVSALALGVVGVALVVVANLVVVGRTSERITRVLDDLDPAQVAIVPGAGVYPDGSLGRPVEERVRAALELYDRGLVEKILVSGDNGTPSYNEPDAMRDAVLEAGVPAADVFTDYAGFSTWHTMRRARDVFEADTAIVVTQGVYAARTVDLGVAAGLDVQGYVVSEGGRRAREWLARVRGLGEATFRPRVTPGPAIPITGDGRTSWADDPA
ncbi:vancomycin high temperature exclusion protein [Aeromicrobium sp.]|uniref:SanA/YdcF family protein n=1 Tax=Aeromicrobium sp. TaxID=1871063 RepID=UPI003512308F